jgi:Cu+-exporting ATPase
MSGQGQKVKQCMLHVEGMACEKCSKTVEQTLEAIKGVEDVKVALDKKQVTVKFEENVDVKALVDAVNAKGFKATLQGEQIILNIEGMHCTHCAAEIKDILEKQQGVISADVSFEKKEAVVTCQPGKVSLEQLVKVIEDNTEYKASSKK